MSKWIYNDGGRSLAGFRGSARDCVTRSISIASGMEYRQVYDDLNKLAKTEDLVADWQRRSSSRLGVFQRTWYRYLRNLGWRWVQTGPPSRLPVVYLTSSDLPTGTLIVSLKNHMTVMRDGVIYDTFDCRESGAKCVHGFWKTGKTLKWRNCRI